MEPKLVQSFDTKFPADSVEWHPNEAFRNYLVCGMYQIEKTEYDETVRKGRIHLMHYDFEKKALRKVSFLNTNAVLDQKWFPKDGHMLTVADSKGFITNYEMKDEKFNEIDQFSIGDGTEEKELLALSLDWNKEGTHLAVSNSHGGITVHQVRPEGFQKIQWSKEHEQEAWTVAFDRNQPNVLYSGGDDTALFCYDLRTAPTPAVQWKKMPHKAGVTSLFSPPGLDNILITGSYDDYIRVFDVRNWKMEKDELNTGGGVWRIKQHPTYSEFLLIANMYASACIVKFDQIGLKLKEMGAYLEHAGLCYGCDWAPTVEEDNLTFVCCSFYDQLLTIGEVDRNYKE